MDPQHLLASKPLIEARTKCFVFISCGVRRSSISHRLRLLKYADFSGGGCKVLKPTVHFKDPLIFN